MERKEFLSIRRKLILQRLGETKLLAVSKHYPIDDIIHAYNAGQRHFGENRVDELAGKAEEATKRGYEDLKWHFVGKLQTNKVNRLLKIKNLVSIHSVDSFKLMDALFKRDDAIEGEDDIGFYLQVRTSDEEEKSGFNEYDDLAKTTNLILNNPDSKLKLVGLMTMSKIRTESFQKDAKTCFKHLAQIGKQLENDFALDPLRLSMGMSKDYQTASKEGSFVARIGSLLFDENRSIE